MTPAAMLTRQDVRAAWRLPAPVLAAWRRQHPDVADTCRACEVPGRLTTAWMWEHGTNLFGAYTRWSRVCGPHAEAIVLTGSIYAVLDDHDPLLTVAPCRDCRRDPGSQTNNGVAEVRLQLTDLTTVDVCGSHAADHISDGPELAELLGEVNPV